MLIFDEEVFELRGNSLYAKKMYVINPPMAKYSKVIEAGDLVATFTEATVNNPDTNVKFNRSFIAEDIIMDIKGSGDFYNTCFLCYTQSSSFDRRKEPEKITPTINNIIAIDTYYYEEEPITDNQEDLYTMLDIRITNSSLISNILKLKHPEGQINVLIENISVKNKRNPSIIFSEDVSLGYTPNDIFLKNLNFNSNLDISIGCESVCMSDIDFTCNHILYDVKLFSKSDIKIDNTEMLFRTYAPRKKIMCEHLKIGEKEYDAKLSLEYVDKQDNYEYGNYEITARDNSRIRIGDINYEGRGKIGLKIQLLPGCREAEYGDITIKKEWTSSDISLLMGGIQHSKCYGSVFEVSDRTKEIVLDSSIIKDSKLNFKKNFNKTLELQRWKISTPIEYTFHEGSDMHQDFMISCPEGMNAIDVKPNKINAIFKGSCHEIISSGLTIGGHKDSPTVVRAPALIKTEAPTEILSCDLTGSVILGNLLESLYYSKIESSEFSGVRKIDCSTIKDSNISEFPIIINKEYIGENIDGRNSISKNVCIKPLEVKIANKNTSDLEDMIDF